MTIGVNSTISHYRIVSRIGAGGTGEVYLAEDSRLDRKVAIKRSNTGFSYDVAPSGDRFLMLRPADENAAPAQIRVVINWKEEVRRRAATQKSGQQ